MQTTTVEVAPGDQAFERDERVVAPRSRWGRVLGDVIAAVALGWMLWHLADNDGGVDLVILARVAWPLLVAAPVAAMQLRRLPITVGVGFAVFAAGCLLSLGFAAFRSDFVAPTLVYAATPIVFLLAHRLWQRETGPLVLGGLLAVALVVSWNGAFLGWAGSLFSEDIADRWLALSWHNQSAVLMAGFGLLLAGVALTGGRRSGAAATLAAGLAFAGAWLAGSRGAVLTTVAGLAVLGIVTRLRRPLRWLGLAAATGTALLLLMSLPSAEPVDQAITGKPLSAAESSTARLHHMAAAVGMFADRPLTGQGIGAYRLASPAYSHPGTNATSFAHNEYAEWFGEGGIVLGVAGLALLFGLGAALWRTMRAATGDGLRAGLTAGAAAAAASLAVHAAIDFDWLFPILAFLLAVTAAMVYGGQRPHAVGSAVPWLLVPVVVLLGIGVFAARVELRPSLVSPGAEELAAAAVPWNVPGTWSVANVLLEAGRADLAAEVVHRAAVWNPGEATLRTYTAGLDLMTGQGSAGAVVATLNPADASFRSYNFAAAFLMEAGELEIATGVLDDVLDLYARYPGWSMRGHIDRTWRLSIDVAAAREGCPGALAEAKRADTHPSTEGVASDYTALVVEACGA